MTSSLPQGPGYVCFDASPLIAYADADQLVWLNTWFGGGVAFTADVVTKVELVKNLKRFPKNKEIVSQPWLRSVPVEEDEDVKLVAQLRRLWGSEEGRDWGEAEVVALCKRNGWTGIIDDHRGRDAASMFGVAYVSGATMLAAAAAATHASTEEMWELHRAVSKKLDRPVLPTDESFRPALESAIGALKKLIESFEGTAWPHVLADRRADQLLARAVARQRAVQRDSAQ